MPPPVADDPAEMLEDEFDFLINHVFLPPKLPHGADPNFNDRLLQMVLHAATEYQSNVSGAARVLWKKIVDMLKNLSYIREKGMLSATRTHKAIRDMKNGDVLLLEIVAQNAALVLRQNETDIQFESFETSPQAVAVISAKGNLRCSYPGPVISVPLEKSKNTQFLTELCAFLEYMDADVLEEATPVVSKGKGKGKKSHVTEVTDTSSPTFITDMLTGVLRALGRPTSVTRIEKRIRDDSVGQEDSKPWRRSPTWLAIRVALQTTLSDKGEYKTFMAYFLAQLIQLAVKKKSSSSKLFVMGAKLARRIYKMAPVHTFVSEMALMAVGAAVNYSNKRWKRHQEEYAKRALWDPTQLSFEGDTSLVMTKSREYLDMVVDEAVINPESPIFNPMHPRRLIATDGYLFERRMTRVPEGPERRLALADLEQWVENSLEPWLLKHSEKDDNAESEENYKDLAGILKDYIAIAKCNYSDGTEDKSIMLLTALELWIALDRVVLHKYPLLKDFAPDFDETLLYPLLLPKASQLERLHKAEAYIRRRKSEAKESSPSIFSDTVDDNTFAVRYFNSSPNHQALLKKIKDDASQRKADKIAQLNIMMRDYNKSYNEAQGLRCNGSYNRRGKLVHGNIHCRRCELDNMLRGYVITVYESPLPKGEPAEKTVVFELICPPAFDAWRDATYVLFVGLCTPQEAMKTVEQRRPNQSLHSAEALLLHALKERGQRLSVMSKTKSSSKEKVKRLPTSEREVCVSNHSVYRLFDDVLSRWAAECTGKCDVSHLCQTTLPDGAYKNLEYAVNDTSHSSNEVIAEQSECSASLSLHEYYAFGALRAGPRLQSMNILRELRAKTLNINSEAVQSVIRTAMWQAGPPDLEDPKMREAHVDFATAEFGHALLSELNHAWAGIESNWLEDIAASTLITITCRLLSLATDLEVVEGALKLLRRSREITLRWTRQVVEQLSSCTRQDDLKSLQIRALRTAATCRATYNVESKHLDAVFDGDVAPFIECGITVHENTPNTGFPVDPSVTFILDRDSRLSHALEGRLRNALIRDRSALDESVSKIWSAYTRGIAWTVLEGQNNRWMVTETAGGADARPLEVQFNLLNGELLIDGMPLGRLPAEYTSDPTFKRIFGEKILDVNPADMPGMIFQVRREINDYQVYFSKRGEQLIIRTKNSEGDIHELIPNETFREDLPNSFIEAYAHWLDIVTSEMELRPIETPWSTSKKNWRISYSDQGDNTVISKLYRDKTQIIDNYSESALMIAKILRPLENLQFMEISRMTDTGLVSISLPRFKLDFFINKADEMECRQFRGMVVDSNQDIKTLVGLDSMLVLKLSSSDDLASTAQRKAIIPDGTISFKKDGWGHVITTIDTMSTMRVVYHAYDVDTKLGRLVGSGSLRSRLYKIYLHAITSYCLPDPLTKRTGTEEALTELRSAATWSFQKLESAEIEMLKNIAALTPTRAYHPRNLAFMQSVTWSKHMHPLAQHEEYYEIISKIFEHDRNFDVFREDKKVKFPGGGNMHLLQRAGIRNAIYRPEEFGGSRVRETEDIIYKSRDAPTSPEARVCSVARLVDTWSTTLSVHDNLLALLQSCGSVYGPSEGESVRIGYSPRWLKIDLGEVWISLYASLRKCSQDQSKYQVMFLLATMAFTDTDMKTIHTLLSFATAGGFRDIHPPKHSYYNLADGFELNRSSIVKKIKSHHIDFLISPEIELPIQAEESSAQRDTRRRKAFDAVVDQQAQILAGVLMTQWPTIKPQAPEEQAYSRISMNGAIRDLEPYYKRRFCNLKLRGHIRRVQAVLDGLVGEDPVTRAYSFQPLRIAIDPPKYAGIRMKHLLRNDPLELPEPPPVSRPGEAPRQRRMAGGGKMSEDKLLKDLIADISASNAYGFGQYAKDLNNSLLALRDQPRSTMAGKIPPRDALLADRDILQEHVLKVYDAITKHLHTGAKSRTGGELLLRAGLGPRITPTALLRLLASDKRGDLTEDWKRMLIAYGKALTYLQRSERLLECAARNDLTDFLKEAANTGGEGWDVAEHPDWLLLQIENNIMIRPVQAQIAEEMIDPESNQNSVIQLNMGEGKTSVIVPMVASKLADGKMLVRVVVLKPLSSQMFQLLVERLGGLINRRIFFMPFTRSAAVDLEKAKLILRLYQECMKVGGVLLCQPEHLLSFKLMGLERLCSEDADRECATKLCETQRWLEENARDILDEADELLHVKYQLIYTLGSQRAIEFSPDRWLVIQQIFGLIRKHAPEIREQYPRGIELQDTAPTVTGNFPSTRVLEDDAGQALLNKIATDICAGCLPSVSFRLFPEELRNLAYRFISDPNIEAQECVPLLEHCKANTSTISTLLLLRGLISLKILTHALGEKRYRVDYGLDVARSMLAVPYRAKDSPTVRSEFSHPDISISLTCLTYYYGGLTEDQIRECFTHLYKLDNPSVQYEKWIDGCTNLPDALRLLGGINLQDNQQFSDLLFPSFKFNKAIIDFFLARTVFPKEAKEFPHKLPSSGWDLAAQGNHPKTGFSGTNDNRYLLPISMIQRDLPEQSSTNAKVLGHLLQPENNNYMCAKKDSGERLHVKELFELVAAQEPKIRVVLDVGAQVLELKNKEVAELWLSLVPPEDVQAAVYFTEQDELTVLTRDGQTEPLLVSSFAKQMDQCVVYLDEVHTRGTDLKLPPDYRAAVMLGPMLIKDRLAQACMRMRKLGYGQSVMFFAPHEVHQKILKLSGKPEEQPIQTTDILRWTIQETCTGTRNSIPLWANQGISFQRRQSAWETYWSTDASVDRLSEKILEREAQTLEELYGLQTTIADPLAAAEEELQSREAELVSIKQRCGYFGITSLAHVRAQEEQEREIELEAEREYQVERPPKALPYPLALHPDVVHFVSSGEIRANSDGFLAAFHSLLLTTAEQNFHDAWPPQLYVTTCFSFTVKLSNRQKIDEYLPPVNWIVSSELPGGGLSLVVMSPFEVDELLPKLRQSNKVRLHLYSPKVTKSMRAFDDLAFFIVTGAPGQWELFPDSAILVHTLNLFAGQLYLRDMQAYEQLCDFLGLYTQETPDNDAVEYIEPDGFVCKPARARLNMGHTSPFLESQVMWLKKIISYRRKGQDYWGTHMGQILHSRLLSHKDFEDSPVVAEEDNTNMLSPPERVLAEGSANPNKRRRRAEPRRASRGKRVKVEVLDLD